MSTKTYNITVSKYYDKNIQSPVLEISCTDAVIELLDNFAIKTETKSTSYATKPREENEDRYSMTFVKRYLVRTVLMQSVNDATGWDNIFDLLFTPEMFNDKKIKIALTSESAFHNIEQKTKNFKSLLVQAEALLTTKKVVATFTTSEADE